MAARAALGRAFVASGATLLGLGAATMVVSSISMGVARVVVTQEKKKTAVACCVCHGNKKVRCDVCRGEKAIRYHPFKAMPVNSSRMPLTACAMCSASGEQTCLNCLGEGVVNPAHPRLSQLSPTAVAAATAGGGGEVGGAVGLGAVVPPTA